MGCRLFSSIASIGLLLLLVFDGNLTFSCHALIGNVANRRNEVSPIGKVMSSFSPSTSSINLQNSIRKSGRIIRNLVPIGSSSSVYPAYNKAFASSAPTTSQLGLHPTVGASLAIAGSSMCGIQISKWFPSGGILGTLVTAAMCGNLLPWVPNKHVLYDMCFSLFLPGSLTLLLLAYQPPPKTTESDEAIRNDGPGEGKVATRRNDSHDKSTSIQACICRVAVPFLVASLASLLGCVFSYRLALAFRWFLSVGPYGSAQLAKITAGIMSASYVGGAVNFMSTARLIGAPAELVGSLITADLFTMALYFAFLSSSLNWDWLASKFGIQQNDTNNPNIEVTKNVALRNDRESDHQSSPITSVDTGKMRSIFLASTPLLISTFGIVSVANSFETLVGRYVPGTACAVIAIVAPLINSLVQNKEFWKPYSKAASVWSDFFFLSFFASIGVEANLSTALSMGPACLLFSSIALSVHVLGTVGGCLLWKKMMARYPFSKKRDSLDFALEDVWIASNAAIGGPATAAAFCGCMKQRDPEKLRGRTISATVWGVFGYAIGTIVGVGMYNII